MPPVTSGSQSQSGNIGVGFAIPGNTAQRIAEEIRETGSATRAFLGVSARTQADGQNGDAFGSRQNQLRVQLKQPRAATTGEATQGADAGGGHHERRVRLRIRDDLAFEAVHRLHQVGRDDLARVALGDRDLVGASGAVVGDTQSFLAHG